ncbi:hypothetical protein NFI08_04800 [Halomonas sp. EF61]|uniref:DUF7668 domain-containing protein n=1 Tax=Halomonas sp. EF61 TaxID=2950869 RepID=UPI0032DEAC67
MCNAERKIRDELQEVISLLVQKKYIELEEKSGGNRLKAYEIESAINEYGCDLAYPPEREFDSINMIEVFDSDPRRWSVRFDLWSEQEGKSDLSIELTIIEASNKNTVVEIDDIHVL